MILLALKIWFLSEFFRSIITIFLVLTDIWVDKKFQNILNFGVLVSTVQLLGHPLSYQSNFFRIFIYKFTYLSMIRGNQRYFTLFNMTLFSSLFLRDRTLRSTVVNRTWLLFFFNGGHVKLHCTLNTQQALSVIFF